MTMTTRLPILDARASSLRSDGSRNYVHPADVRGRFHRIRIAAFALLPALLVALPWVRVGDHPAVFLDIAAREFYLFGATFNAQDVWLLFFPLSAAGFVLIAAAALWGRMFCGYACPQTVFLEGFFRPVERLIEGPRQERLKRNAGPWTLDKLVRKTLKQAIYLVLAFGIAHIVLAYFVSLPGLYRMMLAAPARHPVAFAWAAGLTLVIYFDFSWFREQTCLIVCPYGRLQSVLTDRDTLVIGYDVKRGEPRGKASDASAGACVDCRRCVVVCPTGIDIRNGLQMDCIGCARCVDACDEIMDKLDRPRGLVRYDSSKGLAGEASRFLRPRIALYMVLAAAGCAATWIAAQHSEPYEANVLRLQGFPPFTREGNVIRNAFEVHVVNKRSQPALFTLEGRGGPALQYTIAMPKLRLSSLASQRVPVFVSFEQGAIKDADVAIITVRANGGEPRILRAPLLAP
jgi:cytochrome c oxidase accessory protein FixG